MNKKIISFFLFIALTGMVNAFEISKIKFVDQDNNPIPADMFVNKMKIKAGMEFSPRLLSQAIKSLYETKKVKDINSNVVVVEGRYELIFKMTLNVIVEKIVFEGNNELDDDDLEEVIQHGIGVPLDMEQLSKDKSAIFELYSKEGYFNTELEIKTTEGEIAGEVVVTFQITEKQAYQIDSVTVVGASVFDPEDLVDEFKTQPSFWRYFFDTGFLNEEVFKFDLEELDRKYKARGYLDFKVLDVERVIDDEYINLIIYIKEGSPYTVDGVSMHWMKIPGKDDDHKYVFNEEDLKPLLDTAPGLLYNGDTEDEDIKRMEEKYNNLGYLEFSARTVLKSDSDKRTVSVEYHIFEGVPSVIRDIKIVNNIITKDYVIRREMALHPTDLSNQLLIDKSKNRLLGLGYFKDVEIIAVDTGIEGEKDLRVKVEENETGRLNFGAGFSSASSFIGSAGFQQNNFDLGAGWPFKGGGQKLRAQIEAGTRRSRVEVTFIEPWLYHKPLSLRTSIFHSTRIYDEMDETHTGISADLTSTMKDYPGWRFTRGWRVEQVKVEVENDATEELRDEEVTDIVSTLYFNFVKDTRNRIRRPSKGGTIGLYTDFQSILWGSANNSYKFSLRGSEYFPVFDDTVIKIRGEIGLTDGFGDVPIYDRFFAGGQSSIRGYEFRKVGPLDDDDEELGGKSILLGSVEIDFPIFLSSSGEITQIGIPPDFFFDIAIACIWSLQSIARPGLINHPLGLTDYCFGCELICFFASLRRFRITEAGYEVWNFPQGRIFVYCIGVQRHSTGMRD